MQMQQTLKFPKRGLTLLPLIVVILLFSALFSVARVRAADCTWTHRVRIGDTLSIIARNYETTVSALLTLNPQISNANVIVAGTAEEGLAILQDQRPDVVVSDIGMPGKDGYQFIREVRKLPASAGGRTPAIALTAFARSEDRTRAMLAGFQVHISKPIEPQELIATVAGLAGQTPN